MTRVDDTLLEKTCVDIFAINGSLFELAHDVEKNKEKILKILLSRNKLIRSLGFIHGNIYVENNEVCSFEEPTREEMLKNVNFILVLVAPVILHIIKNNPKSSPELLACANAFGRVRFIKEMEQLVEKNRAFFESDTFELILPNEKTREYIKKLL